MNQRYAMRVVAVALCSCIGGVVHGETLHATFRCEGGKTIDATFDNGANASVRLTLSDGRRRVLPQALSASGARYANAGESIVFWNKGNTAFIEENGRTTYRGCVAEH